MSSSVATTTPGAALPACDRRLDRVLFDALLATGGVPARAALAAAAALAQIGVLVDDVLAPTLPAARRRSRRRAGVADG